MQLVDHDTFLKNLAALFEARKDHGSVWLTHKRLIHDGEDAAMKHEDGSAPDTREYPCLLRVKDGKKTKFSTIVKADDLPRFNAHYGNLLKTTMSATLRKRDKKREKIRADEAAKRKQKMTQPIVLDGHKRGKGRRQRQRKIKALLKQQESQKKHRERESERKKAGTTVAV